MSCSHPKEIRFSFRAMFYIDAGRIQDNGISFAVSSGRTPALEPPGKEKVNCMNSAIRHIAQKRSLWSAFLLGIGFMAALDEIVFHQLLAWHHFYDQSTPLVALMSDGFLHAGELIIFVSGFFLFFDLRRQDLLFPRFAWSGFFLGMGIFQVFDGVIDHKVLRLHQIRYGVDSILPYDIVWNAFGLLLIAVGAVLFTVAQRNIKPTNTKA